LPVLEFVEVAKTLAVNVRRPSVNEPTTVASETVATYIEKSFGPSFRDNKMMSTPFITPTTPWLKTVKIVNFENKLAIGKDYLKQPRANDLLLLLVRE
jgi:hypothetical protein